MDDCNWIRIGDYDWMEVDERFVRRIAGMGLITLIIMSCDMYFLSILAIGHVYQLAMSPLESKQGTVFSLKMNNPLSMEMGRWENEAEGERSGGEQAREGGGGEQAREEDGEVGRMEEENGGDGDEGWGMDEDGGIWRREE